MPRVGTWTLVKFFEQLDPSEGWEHHKFDQGCMFDIDPVNENAFKNKEAYNDWAITAVVRRPWDRYVSGVCEFLFGGSGTGLFPAKSVQDKDLQRLMLNLEKGAVPSDILYLSHSLKSNYQFIRETLENLYGLCKYDISLNNNMHTRNWLESLLHGIDLGGNIKVVTLTELQPYLQAKWPKQHFGIYNTTSTSIRNNVERALTDMMIHKKVFKHRLEEYLEPEITRFDTLISKYSV